METAFSRLQKRLEEEREKKQGKTAPRIRKTETASGPVRQKAAAKQPAAGRAKSAGEAVRKADTPKSTAQTVRTSAAGAKKSALRAAPERVTANPEQYTLLEETPQLRRAEITMPLVKPIDTAPEILTEETARKERFPNLLGQVTLGRDQRQRKIESPFPTFQETRAGQERDAGLTDRFLPTPTPGERAWALFSNAMNTAMGDIDQAGDFYIEQNILRERENIRRLEELPAEIEAAKTAGDLKRALELETEWRKLREERVLPQHYLYSDLDMLGWEPEEPEKNPFYGEAARSGEILKRGLTPAAEDAAGLLQGAGGMLANTALSGASGVPLPLINAVQQFGQAGTEALEKGHAPDTAMDYALASGALSYGIEKMGGVAGDWGSRLLQKAASTEAGQSLLSRVPETALRYIRNLSQNKAVQLLGEGLSEGGEEFGEYSLQLLLRNMMLDEDTPFDVKEALANAGAGVLFGTAFKSGDLLTDLDVSGVRDKARGLLESRLETGTEKPDFHSPLLSLDTRAETGYDTGVQKPQEGGTASTIAGGPEKIQAAGKGREALRRNLYEVSARFRDGQGGTQNGIIRGSEESGQRIRSAGGTAPQVEQTPDGGGLGKNRGEDQGLRRVYDSGRGFGRRDEGTGSPAGQGDRSRSEASRKLNQYIRDRRIQRTPLASGGMALYKPVSASPESNAGKAKAVLDSLGIPVDIAQGEVVLHSPGNTQLNSTAVTIRGRNGPMVLLHDNLDIDGETAGYHEAYHYIGNTAPELREAFLDTLADNIDYNGDFQEFISRITGGYITPETMAAGPEQITDKLLEEFGAYVCGEIKNRNPDSEGWRMMEKFLKDPEAVYESMLYMFRDFKNRAAGETAARADSAGTEDFSQVLKVQPPEVDTSVLRVEKPNFNSPLLLNQRAMREREATGDLAKKREAYLQEKRARLNTEPVPPPETEAPGPGEAGQREAEAFLNQQAETPAPENPRPQTERKAQNQFLKAVRRVIPVSGRKAQETFRQGLSEAAAEYQATGKVSEQTRQRIFDGLYDSAQIVDDAYYRQYKGLKDEIRSTKFYVSNQDRANISDFEGFRKANMGNFTVTKDSSAGIPVDVKYQELSGRYPAFFPADITDPAAQLERISEISKGISRTVQSLDEYYGQEAEEAKEFAREAFEEAMARYTASFDTVDSPAPSLSEEDREDVDLVLELVDQGLLESPEEADVLRRQYREAREAIRRYYQATEGLLPSERWNAEGVAKGHITPEQVPEYEAAGLILEAAEARRAMDEAMEPIKAYNKERMARGINQAREAVLRSDFWKDKPMGILLSRETMERNMRDIIPDPAEAEMLIDTYFTETHINEAKLQRFLRKYRDQVGKLKLTEEESFWVQKIGEGLEALENLPVHLDAEKIDRAITLLRDKIYPELYNMVSDVLMLNGYAPPGYVENYFPHFTDPDDLFSQLFRMFGMDVDMRELPTEIAGTTETRKPGKAYSPFLQRRTGDVTVYDAVRGFDKYLESIGNIIFHTGDIQKGRFLEYALRDKYGKKIKNFWDDVNRQEMPVGYFADLEQDELFGKDMRHLSHLTTEIRSYYNHLAGKKDVSDRSSERDLSRGMYSASQALANRVMANMVGGNVSSVLTNLVPLTQGGAELSVRSLSQAMWDTFQNIRKPDGFEERSTFLTNRRGSRKLAARKAERVGDALTAPSQAVDLWVAHTLVRGRYLDNLKSGMTAERAMLDADKWAASVMADRSRGAKPTLFERKNPITKAITGFQLELNNQWSHFFKDIPRDSKSKKKLVSTIIKMGLYSFLAGTVMEWLTGRDPTVNPIGTGMDFYKDLTDEDKTVGEAFKGLGEDILEQTPFTAGLNLVGIEGGSRYPVSAAIPDLSKIGGAVSGLISGDMAPNAALEQSAKELAKPGYYLLPPAGGGQLKKTLEGADVLLNAGSYKTNRDGGETLQYPVDTDPFSALRILTFGKSSAPQAQEYYETWKPVQPETAEGQADAMARSLPRIVSYTTGEGPNKKKESVTLSAEQQRKYQELFLERLPEDLDSLSDETRDLYYDYAKQAAKDEILEEAGVPEYEPESWANKMKAAVDAGVSPEEYLEIREFFDTVEPQKTGGRNGLDAVEIKRKNLMDNQNLTPEQKRLLDELLIGGKTQADYTDEDSFYRSQMSDRRKKQYDAAASAVPGISAREFDWVMNSLSAIHSSKDKDGNTVKGSEKEKQITYLLDRGFSLQEAYDLYNVQDLPSEYSGVSEYGVSYDAYSESMKKQYQAVVSLFGETKTSTFEYYRDLAEGISSKSGKEAALVQSGLTERQALAFLSALDISEKDTVDFSSPDRVLYSTLTDSQRVKYEAVTQYIPGMPVSDYLYFKDRLALVDGDRDQYGKTISGTKKRNIITTLMQMGMNYYQALVFYNIVE